MHNWLLIESIRYKQTKILEPYFLAVKESDKDKYLSFFSAKLIAMTYLKSKQYNRREYVNVDQSGCDRKSSLE